MPVRALCQRLATHDRDGLRREWFSQQSRDPWRDWIVELMECRVLPKNALSQKSRVSAHVVVDRAKFRHESPPQQAKRARNRMGSGKEENESVMI
jgi:hypothetical protein